MKVNKTITITITQKEKEAIKTVYDMLENTDFEDEVVIAKELDDDDFEIMKYCLIKLHKLSGGTLQELQS